MSNVNVRQRWLIVFVTTLAVNVLIGIGEHGRVTTSDLVFGVGLGLGVASAVVLGRPREGRTERRRGASLWPVVMLVLLVVGCFVGARLV